MAATALLLATMLGLAAAAPVKPVPELTLTCGSDATAGTRSVKASWTGVKGGWVTIHVQFSITTLEARQELRTRNDGEADVDRAYAGTGQDLYAIARLEKRNGTPITEYTERLDC